MTRAMSMKRIKIRKKMTDASASVCQLQAVSKLKQTAEKWRNSFTYSNRESRLPIQTLHLSPPYGNSPLLMVSQEEGEACYGTNKTIKTTQIPSFPYFYAYRLHPSFDRGKRSRNR